MPRFYFHVHNSIVAEDEEGTELAGLQSAIDHAKDGARDIACENIRRGHLNLDHFIRVTDETGAEVAVITYRDAFAIEGKR